MKKTFWLYKWLRYVILFSYRGAYFLTVQQLHPKITIIQSILLALED